MQDEQPVNGEYKQINPTLLTDDVVIRTGQGNIKSVFSRVESKGINTNQFSES